MTVIITACACEAKKAFADVQNGHMRDADWYTQCRPTCWKRSAHAAHTVDTITRPKHAGAVNAQMYRTQAHNKQPLSMTHLHFGCHGATPMLLNYTRENPPPPPLNPKYMTSVCL